MASITPQIADYFVVVGLPDQPQYFQELSSRAESPTKRPTTNLDPITDVAVIFKALGDPVPVGYECIETTPTGLSANLNFGSSRVPEAYLCFRRSSDRPALTNMGVMVEGAVLLENAGAVFQTPTGRIANINNASSPCLYVTYSRSPPNAATLDNLVVMDICVINASKGEVPPHTFCKINQKLNTGIFDDEMYLCYRKARLRDHVLSFKPEVLSRYPFDDTTAPYPLNDNIPMFCMPLGASLEVWPVATRDPQPIFSSFVLSGSQNDSSKSSDENFFQYYGYVLNFYESCTIEQLSSLQINGLGLSQDVPLKDQGKRIVSSKAICLLSQYAFFSEFKQYLTHIYKMSFTENHCLPIERFISHLLHEVPVPSAAYPRILAQLSSEEPILFTSPEDVSPIPASCASFNSLLSDLGVEKTLDVFLYALLGHSLLINSIRSSVLTLACETIKTMIFPFIWSYPFIPYCPLALAGGSVQCPMSFIIGVDSSYFDWYEPPPGVICIDLDTGNILLPQDKKTQTAVSLLPKKPAAQLRARLENVYKTLKNKGALFSDIANVSNDVLLELQRQREALELECREAFLYFMATILRGYRAFLIVPTNFTTNLGGDSLFRTSDFVRTRNKSLAKFFEVLNLDNSQNFKMFLQELTSSTRPQGFDFFNDCCRKVDEDMQKSATSPRRLIEGLHDLDNERVVVIPPPSSRGLEDGKRHSYSNFPLLDASKFLPRTRVNSKPIDNVSSGDQQFDWNIVKRTAQEINSCTTILNTQASMPCEWAKIIQAHSYAVWFSILPAFCGLVHSQRKLLTYAVSVVHRNLTNFGKSLGDDQTAFRVIFALSNAYPAIAVQLLMHIRKKKNFELNTATLALSSKVLYRSQIARLWGHLRSVVYAIAQFRAAGVRHRSRPVGLIISIKQGLKLRIKNVLDKPLPPASAKPIADLWNVGRRLASTFSSMTPFPYRAREQPDSVHDSMDDETLQDDVDIVDDLWPLPAKREECRVQVVLCAANKCPSPKCGQILLEEDVMARWSASDFKAACPVCGLCFVPNLEVYLKDFRSRNDNNEHDGASETDRQTDAESCSGHRLRRCQSEIMTTWSASELVRNGEHLAKRPFRLIGPISCLFLSPLALRKEIEQHVTKQMNINSTSMLFADSSFVDNQERLYWNLLFVFARMKLPSHLPSLVMFSRLLTGNSNSYANVTVSELREAASHVNVLVVWDNLALYPMSERPLYWHWAVNFGNEYPVVNALVDYWPFSRRLMSKLLTSIRQSDMLNAMKLVFLIRRRGLPNELFFRNHSMYHILLNLSIVALGRNNIGLKAFDSTYFNIFTRINSAAASSSEASRVLAGTQPLSNELRLFDQPPSGAAMYCRRAHLYADMYHDFEQRPNFVLQFPHKSSMATAAAAQLTNEQTSNEPPPAAAKAQSSSSLLNELVDSSVIEINNKNNDDDDAGARRS